MSAEIIQFARGPKRHRGHFDFPTIAFRSAASPEDLVMDHADPEACEHAGPGLPG